MAAGLAAFVAQTVAVAHEVRHTASQGTGGNRPAIATPRPAPVAHVAGQRTIAPRPSVAAASTRGGPVPHAAAMTAAAPAQLHRREARAALASPPVQSWNTGWHNDRNYDWADWRARHRDLFHIGYYAPPYGGYAYVPIGIGGLLAPEFMNDEYGIDDPSIYHLPPAQDPYRWVRYYNDCLLVDLDTGEVVDVVHDVFW